MKPCSRCHKILPYTQFFRRSNRPDGLRSECKACCLIDLQKRKNVQNPWARSLEEILIRHIPPLHDDCCQEWTGPRFHTGYGTINFQRKIYLAHRVVYEKARGPIPDGLVIMHLCDNPPCVRLDHLQLGTYKENGQDASHKLRYMGGVSTRKLTQEQADEIRQKHAQGKWSYEYLGNLYGISHVAVSNIINNKTYRTDINEYQRLRQETINARLTLIKIAERDHWTCQLCYKKVTKQTWSTDHIIPRSKGGTDIPNNLVLAHKNCNRSKGNRTVPQQQRLF